MPRFECREVGDGDDAWHEIVISTVGAALKEFATIMELGYHEVYEAEVEIRYKEGHNGPPYRYKITTDWSPVYIFKEITNVPAPPV